MLEPEHRADSDKGTSAGRGDRRLVVLESGRVVAASPGARGEGVEVGMTRARVETVCPGAAMRLRDPSMEAAAWQRVERRLNRATPYVETVTPGRAFVRPHDISRLAKAVDDLGAQAALAPSRTVAQLASGKALDGELLQIRPEHVDTFLRRLPVKALAPDLAPEEVVERLELFGYGTVYATQQLSRRHLAAQFGDTGAQLHRALHGDSAPVSAYVPPPSIRRTHDFDHDQREPGAVKKMLQDLVEQATDALGGRTAQRLRVEIDDRRMSRARSARTLRAPTSDPSVLSGIATTLLHALLHPAMRLTRVRVELSALATPSGQQGQLFNHRPAVQKAIRAVEQKHPGALKRAVTTAAAIFDEDRFRLERVTA